MDNLLAIINVIQRIGTRKLLVQLISNMVIIMGLVMTTAIMISATIIGGLINAHISLLNHEIPPVLALIYIGCAALLIIASLLAMIAWRLRCLRKSPLSLFGGAPLASRAMDTLDAFTAGLMAEK
ncbi:MAG: hypothetical protein SFX19_05315 [Alphaproteobacteria bacterium]|nr:hypothetical protein [Alphaproteobacteria bacterium]